MKFNLHNSYKSCLHMFISALVLLMITSNGMHAYGAVDTKSREYDFTKLLKGQENISLDDLLKDYAPIQLNIFVSPEYISGVIISNAANAGNGNITNIDISKNANVAKFLVEINSQQYEAKLVQKGSSQLYNLGVTTLKNGDDIKIIAKNANGEILQTKVIKFNEAKSSTTIANLKDLSKKGEPYTLQELIKSPSLLYDVLKRDTVKLRTTIYLDDVVLDYQNNKLINTTSEMEYSLNSTTGINGTWNPCSDNETINISYGSSKKVYIREALSKGNYREVGNSNGAVIKYTIDYLNESTMEVIPTTVEYAEDADFTKNKKYGENKKIDLSSIINVSEGAKTLYFRVKATDKTLPGNIFQLSIPARPTKPTLEIDYANETTTKSVSSNIEYAEDILFTKNVKVGENKPVALTPGKDLYFRVKASSTTKSFSSKEFKLQVKDRTTSNFLYNFDVNYIEEKTLQIVPTTVEYSEDANFTVNVKKGTGKAIDLNPGDWEKHLYFRYTATASEFAGDEVFILDIKARPNKITDDLLIDFQNEKTKNKLAAEVQYSEDINFTYNVKSSLGEVVSLKPGVTYYFRKRATESDFSSIYKKLVVPQRPSSTTFTIDYQNNVTVENISTTVEWSNNSNFSGASIGGNGGVTAQLSVNEGSTYYFRYRATDSAFAGEVQELRKMPTYTINFEKEMTNEKISKDIEWSYNKEFSGSTLGNDEPITLVPGKTYYFRPKKSSQYYVQILEVPVKAKMTNITLLPGTTIGTFKLTDLQVGSDYEYIMSTSSSVPVDWSKLISLKSDVNVLDNMSSNDAKYFYIRLKSKSTEFASEILSLQIKVKTQ